MKLLIFDLDGTLGIKTPLYPLLSTDNVKILKSLCSDDNIIAFATSRPKENVYLGMNKSGLTTREIENIFKFRVYEDGYYIEYNDEKIVLFDDKQLTINNEKFSPHTFPKIVELLKSEEFIRFINSKNYVVSDSLIKETELIPICKQNNIVKFVYRSVDGYLNNDIRMMKHVFDTLGKLCEDYLDKYMNEWKDHASIVVWDDAIDLYPKIGPDLYVKHLGIEKCINMMKLNEIKFKDVIVCGDGINDISMMKWIISKYENSLIITPSNLSDGLRHYLNSCNHNYFILEEDCNLLMNGLLRYLN